MSRVKLLPDINRAIFIVKTPAVKKHVGHLLSWEKAIEPATLFSTPLYKNLHYTSFNLLRTPEVSLFFFYY